MHTASLHIANENNVIQEFLQVLRALRSCSLHTVDAYERDLVAFCAFLHKTPLLSTSKEDVHGYLLHLSKQGYAAKTIARHLSCLRQFFLFALREGLIETTPLQDMATPKKERTLPRVPSREEIDLLLGQAGQAVSWHQNEITELLASYPRKGLSRAQKSMLLSQFQARRFLCLLEMVYGSGLRVSELLSLTLQQLHIDQDNPVFIVKGKGGTQRLVPCSQRSIACLESYFPIRKLCLHVYKGEDSAYAFPSLSGRHSAVKPITRQRFFQLIKEACGKAGLPLGAFSPHAFRHAFATHLVEGGANLLAVQHMLGHADIATTQIYTHVAGKALLETVQQYHPMAKGR